MAEFKYRASDADGKISEGAISAADKREATALLAAMKLAPITIKAVSESEAREKEKNSSQLKNAGGEKTALALFKKLKQLCGGGAMPVSDAIKALGLRSLDRRVKAVSAELYKDLSEGKTLAAALRKYPDTFDASITHLVEAGESTANLGRDWARGAP
ncbi:MAG: type II secretion system F family protein, partial [Opitutales bacterium]|nr:type II secretion system F family protein [Opitutales bacterium]